MPTKILETCRQTLAAPTKEVEAWKEDAGGKVIGWFPMYAPEELIHAAGVLPVYLYGRHEPVTAGNKCLESFICPPIRHMVDSLLKRCFDICDGLFFVKVCDEGELTVGAIDMLRVTPWIHLLRRPHIVFKPLYQERLLKDMNKARNHIEELAGHMISNESLSRSISIYNANRSMLRQIYELRRKKPGLLRVNDVRGLVASSMLMPKEKHNQLLQELIPKLRSKQGLTKGIKVILAGGICADPGEGILEALEEVGMVVVDDELFVGGRYFSTDVSADGQPVEALARYHWEKKPCPCSLQSKQRTYAPYLVDMAKRSDAQAIIEFRWKYCAYQSYERPYLAETFKQKGIPYLAIELAEEAMDHETLRTHLEAFIETKKLREDT